MYIYLHIGVVEAQVGNLLCNQKRQESEWDTATPEKIKIELLLEEIRRHKKQDYN